MTLQKVFRLHSAGSLQNLKMSEENIPSPDKYEVLIRIRGVSLNYRDIAIVTGTYPLHTKENVIPCSDAAGEVIEVGQSVENFKPGDRVVANFDASNLYGVQRDHRHTHGGTIDGFLREYVTLHESTVVKMPSNTRLSFIEMATLPCAGVTAWNSLFGHVPIKPGQSVLFQGESSRSMTGRYITTPPSILTPT
jgi:NADPH:quinone reductase-like Zn-dependent oxidoreductase